MVVIIILYIYIYYINYIIQFIYIYIIILLGKCILHDFKVFSKIQPLNIVFSLILENYNQKIKLSNETFIMDIRDCDDTQIKIYNKNGFYYCEDPICYSDCPISNGTAICVKGNLNINNIVSNKCTCLPGWIGEKCLNKDIIKIK